MRAIETPDARIVARTRVAWRSDRDRELAGLPHPRAASGLAWCSVGGSAHLVLVQDDAASLALVDPLSGLAHALTLPMSEGHRFDPGHGDKRHKPDLECCLVATLDGRETLLAFGSGSTSARERVAVAHFDDLGSARLVPAHGLYAGLRACSELAGSALNIEGAVVHAGRLWLFQRGNGGAHPALASVSIDGLWAHLRGGPAPNIEDVRAVALGTLGGVPLGFTDAASLDGRLWWLASAEASANTYDDGLVTGSAIGVLDGPWAPLRTEQGAPFTGKAEGLAMLDAHRAWVAIDPDDPELPAELLEVALTGWHSV